MAGRWGGGRRSTRGVVLTNTGKHDAGREKRAVRGGKRGAGSGESVWRGMLERRARLYASAPPSCYRGSRFSQSPNPHAVLSPRANSHTHRSRPGGPARRSRVVAAHGSSAGCSLCCTSAARIRTTVWTEAHGGRRTRRKKRSARRLTVRRNDSRPSPRSRS